MTFSVTLSGLFILTIIVAALALYDGIVRLRGRRAGTVFAVVEIIAALLLALTQFFTLPAPLTALVFVIILEVVLVIALVLRGGRYRWVVTVIALVLNTILLLRLLGWLTIPGVL